jgi:hypothetical protein
MVLWEWPNSYCIKLPHLNALFYNNPQFLFHSRGYNNLFEFSALGVSEGFQAPKSGPSLVKNQGRIHHRVFDLNFTGSMKNLSLYAVLEKRSSFASCNNVHAIMQQDYNKKIISIGCIAHIMHNALSNAVDKVIPIDIEDVV